MTRKYLYLALLFFVFSVSTVHATLYTLDAKGESATLTGALGTAYVILYDDAMQDLIGSYSSSGTGVIDPFLTLQKNEYEEGMNTDGSLIYDAKRGGNPGYADAYTHSLQYSSLLYSPFGFYEDYFTFSCDTDQTGDNPLIQLTDFEVWVIPEVYGGFLDEYSDLGAYGTLKFDLVNGTTGDQALIDYSIWKGSGNKLDFALFVPSFSANPGDYIYIWSTFGTGDKDIEGFTNDGPEEWILVGNERDVPEPTTLLLLGLGLVGLGLIRKKS